MHRDVPATERERRARLIPLETVLHRTDAERHILVTAKPKATVPRRPLRHAFGRLGQHGGVEHTSHEVAVQTLIERGLPPLPARLPVGEEAAVPLALWVGVRAAAALWAWRVDNPQPLVLPDGRQLAPYDCEYDLLVWERTADGWHFDMSSGGEWYDEIGASLAPPFTDQPGWRVLTQNDVGPFWWGGVVGHLDDSLVIVPGIAPPQVASIELRDPSGAVLELVVPRTGYGVFILATEVSPVVPVAIGEDGRDLVGDDGVPLISPQSFFDWEEFAGPRSPE